MKEWITRAKRAGVCGVLALVGCGDDPCVDAPLHSEICFYDKIPLAGRGEPHAVADADNDGIDDLLVLEGPTVYDAALVSLRSVREGVAERIQISRGTHAGFGDLDGDGLLEIISLEDNARSVAHHLEAGQVVEVASFWHNYLTNMVTVNSTDRGVEVAGLNWGGVDFYLMEFRLDGSVFPLAERYLGGAEELRVGDLDGDGLHDVAVRSIRSQQIRAWVSGFDLWTRDREFGDPVIASSNGEGRLSLVERRGGRVMRIDGAQLVDEPRIFANGGAVVPSQHPSCPLIAAGRSAQDTAIYLPTKTASNGGKGRLAFKAEDFGEVLLGADLTGDGVCDLVVRDDLGELHLQIGQAGSN